MSWLTRGLTEAEIEDFEERAAILEHEAHLPREKAERKARIIILERRKENERRDEAIYNP